MDESSSRLQGALSATLEVLRGRDGSDVRPKLEYWIDGQIPTLLRGLSVVSSSIRVLHGWGVGRIAQVPWVSLKSRGETATVTEGYYLSYLFARHGQAVYLCLQTSVDGVTRKQASQRADQLREAAGLQGDLATSIDLFATADLPRKYEAGLAYAVAYRSGGTPVDSQLEEDLARMLELLNSVVRSGFKLD